jgi:hypothetical protein
MINSATKQSILSFRGGMDCFAEPVIGRHSRDPLARNDGWDSPAEETGYLQRKTFGPDGTGLAEMIPC